MADNNNWAIEILIKKAWARVKERFLSYILLLVLEIAAAMISLVFAIILMVPLFLTKNLTIIGLIAVPLFFALLGLAIFFGSWVQLTLVYLLISDKNMGLSASLREMRPLVFDYFKFGIISGLFFLGLLPWIPLSLLSIAVLWALWSAFVPFVYLKDNVKGMNILWTSKAYFNQKFMAIAGRIILINFVILAISSLLNGADNGFLQIVGFCVSIVTGPFVIAYTYEIFNLLEKPKKVESSKLWVGLSIAGWVLMAVIAFSLASQIPKIPGFIKDVQIEMQRQNMMKENPGYENLPINQEDIGTYNTY